MTRDDIIRMARKADVWVVGQEPYQTQLERFAALVAAAEREACAKEIRGYFAAARFDNRTLGLGDVRVTVRDVDDLAQSICKNPLQVGSVKECLTVEAAVKAEREACAKVCDQKVDAEYATGKVDHNEIGWTQACAIAIRARGKT